MNPIQHPCQILFCAYKMSKINILQSVMGIYWLGVDKDRWQMRLKNAQKNVHDALFFVHGSGGSNFLLLIIDWEIEILTT